MQNYHGNPDKGKAVARPAPDQPADRPKVEKVVTNPVVRRKKNIGRRFKETFFSGASARSAFQFVIFEVMIPAAKDMMVEAGKEMLEQSIYGDAPGRGSHRTVGSRLAQSGRHGATRVAYERFSSPSLRPDPRTAPARPSPTRVSRTNPLSLDDFIVGTRAEAEEILARMDEILARYKSVSLRDLYEMMGESTPYTIEHLGWVDLSDARIIRRHGGYLLDLPVPEDLS